MKKRYADCLDGHVWLVENDLFKCRYCGIIGDTCPECWALLPDEPDEPECKRCGGSGVVALVSIDEGKASLVVGVTDDLKDKISAVDLVRAGSAVVGGKGGGGRADMAQAGGPEGARAAEAIEAIERALAKAL